MTFCKIIDKNDQDWISEPSNKVRNWWDVQWPAAGEESKLVMH